MKLERMMRHKPPWPPRSPNNRSNEPSEDVDNQARDHHVTETTPRQGRKKGKLTLPIDPRCGLKLLRSHSDEVVSTAVFSAGNTPTTTASTPGRDRFGAIRLYLPWRKNAPTEALQDKGCALRAAVSSDDAATVRLLMNEGVDPDTRDNAGWSPLMLAAEMKACKAALALLEGGASARVRAPRSGWTVLHVAAHSGSNEIVRAVCKRGGLVDGPDEMGRTPLHIAAMRGHSDIIEALISAGAWPDAVDDLEWAPLHHAIACEHVSAVASLLDNGASPTAGTTHDVTPLHLAARRNLTEVGEMLVSQGASADVLDCEHRAPLALTTRESFRRILMRARVDDSNERRRRLWDISPPQSVDVHRSSTSPPTASVLYLTSFSSPDLTASADELGISGNPKSARMFAPPRRQASQPLSNLFHEFAKQHEETARVLYS